MGGVDRGPGSLTCAPAHRAWTIYGFLYGATALCCVEKSVYLLYLLALKKGMNGRAIYHVVIAFSNLSSTGFVGVLLMLACGLCVTRTELGEERGKVIGIPVVMLVAGLVRGWGGRGCAWAEGGRVHLHLTLAHHTRDTSPHRTMPPTSTRPL